MKIKKVNEMSDKREKIHIDKEELKEIIFNRNFNANPVYGFILIEDNITSADEEDGGAYHDIILKRVVDDKFFKLQYCNWDIDYNFESDFPENLTEVFPKQITITKYI